MEISGWMRRFLQGADCWGRAGKCREPLCAKPCWNGDGRWGCHKHSRAFTSLQSRSQNLPSQAVRGVFFCFDSIYLFPFPPLPSRWKQKLEPEVAQPITGTSPAHITTPKKVQESFCLKCAGRSFGTPKAPNFQSPGTAVPPQEHLVLLGEALALITHSRHLKLGERSLPELSAPHLCLSPLSPPRAPHTRAVSPRLCLEGVTLVSSHPIPSWGCSRCS